MSAAHADRLRGHYFLPAESDLRTVPALYATENVPPHDKVLHMHFFVGACDWYVAELRHPARQVPSTPAGNWDLAFGWVNLGDPHAAEWGYFSLRELRSVSVKHPSGAQIVVERDLMWRPTLFRDSKEAQR